MDIKKIVKKSVETGKKNSNSYHFTDSTGSVITNDQNKTT